MSTFSSRRGQGNTLESLGELISATASDLEEVSAAMVFCGPTVDSEVLTGAAAAFPFPVGFVTTAGQFTHEGRCDGEVVVCAVGGASVLPVFEADIRTHADRAGKALSNGFHDAGQNARRGGQAHSATLLLTDGLSNSAASMVDSLRKQTRPHQIIAGGAAGDSGEFKETRVGLGGEVSSQGAVALHFFDAHRWGIGLGHGLSPATERMTVTRAHQGIVYEINGRPAFEAYRDFAASKGEEITPESVGTFMIRHELGVYFFDELRFARAPLKVMEDGALLCAAAIDEGSTVCILDGEIESMISAARSAAAEARANLRGREAAGVIVFDCVCRGLLLDQAFEREINAVEEEFGNVPIAGFLTYGEIARYGGKLQGWHNTTAVVVAIPA